MVQTYLSSAIDDHSRYTYIYSEFYASQEESIVEDTFRKVVLKAGKLMPVTLITGHSTSQTAETLPGETWDHNPPCAQGEWEIERQM